MRAWLGALAVAAALAGCGPAGVGPRDGPAGPRPATAGAAPASPSQPDLPAGWRWEAYDTIAIGVPQTWGYAVSGSPNCGGPQRRPHVGRPGPMALIGCFSREQPDPATLAGRAGSFVWLEPSLPRDRRVTVQAPAALRSRILGTLRRAAAGVDGCPVRHPVAADFAWRPPAGPPVTALTGVTAVSACRYGRRLISTLRLTGAAAARSVAAVAASRVGGGPNRPSECAASWSYGDEVLLLRVHADQGTREVVLRYHGCDHNGFDDGRTVRTLTRDAAAPFAAGANQVNASWVGTFDLLR